MKKITLKNGLTLLMLITVAFFTTNCKSQKTVAETPQAVQPNDPNRVIRYCYGKEYYSDANYYRASATANSQSQDMADQKALTSARIQLAAQIKALVKSVTETYGRSMEKQGKEDQSADYQKLGYEIVNQALEGSVPFCQEMTQNGNTYTAYVAVQVPVAKLENALIEGLSKDEKTQINFDKFQFKKIYDAEMKDFKGGESE